MTFLQEMATNMEERSDRRHKKIHQMQRNKEQRCILRKMNKVSSKANKGGLSKVMIVKNGLEIHKSKENEIVKSLSRNHGIGRDTNSIF